MIETNRLLCTTLEYLILVILPVRNKKRTGKNLVLGTGGNKDSVYEIPRCEFDRILILLTEF